MEGRAATLEETTGGRTAAPDPRERTALVRLKPRDAWWTVLVVDLAAVPLVRLVSRWSFVTPNRITLASSVVGVGAGVAFGFGQLVLGGLLFQAAFLLDCMDGKLASLRGVGSEWGRYFDVAADAVKFTAASTGLVYHVAGDGSLERGFAALIVGFLGMRVGSLMLDSARPVQDARVDQLEIPATSRSALRAAPSRLAKPGSTVDMEAVAFTLAPIAMVPLAGFAIACAMAVANFAWALGKGILKARRGA